MNKYLKTLFFGISLCLSGVLVFAQDAYIPSNNSGSAATAIALAANGTNCAAGHYPLGVDASGNAESCTDALAISGATIDNSVIGGVTPATGAFTTVQANTSVNIGTTAGGQAGSLVIYDNDGSSPESITINPPSGVSLSTSYILTLPVDDGTSGQVLLTDGSGSLSWTTDIGGNSATATALASDPTDCGSNNYATGIDAGGNLTCSTVFDGGVSNALTISGGTINNTPIGSTSPSSGTFTSLTVNTTSSLGGQITFSSGTSVTAGSYQIGRDTDATNQLHFNAPTGATMEFSINDVAKVIFSDTATTYTANVSCTTITSGNCFNVGDANALTTGGILNLVSNASSSSSRDLVYIKNQHTSATNTTLLNLQQDANAPGLNILSSATTKNALAFNTTAQTTANIITVPAANNLTTGSILNLSSNSSNSSTRSLVNVTNSHASSTGATVLSLTQNSTNAALNISRAAVSSSNNLVDITDAGTSSGPSLKITKSGTSYGNNIGALSIARTGNFTGVAGEVGVDLKITPAFTLTEPSSGSFSIYGASIDMNSISVTSGSGTSVVAALNLTAGSDTDAGTNLALLTAGDIQIVGKILGQKNTDVATASTITIPNGNAVTLTGNTNIDYITTTGWTAGSTLILQFTGTPTVNHNTGSVPANTGNVQLMMGLGFSATANDTLTLYYDGTSWREIARTVI